MLGVSSQSTVPPTTMLNAMADHWTQIRTFKTEAKPTAHIEAYLPAGTFDTHVHVFDPRVAPYAQDRSYTPQRAPLQDLIEYSQRFTPDFLPANLILVQPSPYGTDNTLLLRCLLQLRQAGLNSCRGIAVVDLETVDLSELRKLHDAGVRGIRINTEASGVKLAPFEILKRISKGIDLVKALPNWCIQVFVSGSIWKTGFELFASSPVPIIADHFGGLKGKVPTGDVLNQPGMLELVELARRGKVFIKLSAPYRALQNSSGDYSALEPIVRVFAHACEDALIYGSDWPHTGSGHDRVGRAANVVEPFRVVDQLSILRQMREWVGSDSRWEKICIENPIKLYGPP